MDKKVIFAVAGSGKTTHIVNSLTDNKRSLIVTYTTANYENLRKKITAKFNGVWPANITLMTYFSFLFSFCYKPFLSDKHKARGVIYEPNNNTFIRQTSLGYYMTKNRYLYSNRLALLLEKEGVLDDIMVRIRTYFDEFIIDEVQDIAGRDFTFLESLMGNLVNMLFVGDFYQHTFDTSRDGKANSTLFDDKRKYEARFTKKGFEIDNVTLKNSWRCSQSICDYISVNLGINISSNRPEEDNATIKFINDEQEIEHLLIDEGIVKLHYQNGAKYGSGHKNWGESKGEDHYKDVCVMLNKTTAKKRLDGKLCELPSTTKNKLYVAITRARGNVYLINDF